MSRRKITKRSRKPKKTQANGFRRRLRYFLYGFSLLTLFLFLTYLGYLDYTVRYHFEGKRWALPAWVYASPLELYAGYPITADQLENMLEQLNYRKDPKLSSPASYFRNKGQIALRTRAFQFADGMEPSRTVRLAFRADQLADLYDENRADRLALLRLDPVLIGSFYPTRQEDRILVRLEEVPEVLLKALLSIEDRDYYQHHGISFRAILRALWANLKAGGIVQGGSTITQQLVKNFYLTSERSWWRKFNEAIMALILDARYGKDEILEAYLNEIYLGQERARAIHGFGLASEFYFNRSLRDLELHHIALLVALVRGPSYYDPRRHPDRVLDRRNRILEMMREQRLIAFEQAEKAKHKPLEVTERHHFTTAGYPAFLDLVKRQLRLEYRDEDLTSEGLRIFTTLDVIVQQQLEKRAVSTLRELEKRQAVQALQSAVIITRRDSGEVVALLSGRDPREAGFNRALDALRPIGSLIKPAIYLTALESSDYTVTTLLDDTPVRLKNERGDIWAPTNYDQKFHGRVAFHTALAHSYNLATVHLGLDVGLARVAKTLRHLGVSRPINLYPSLLLGASAFSPLEVAQMYQTLAGDGFATPLRAIRSVLSKEGEALQRYPLTVRQTVDPGAVYIINTILQEAMREGTGRSVYNVLPDSFKVVGKTGTTDDLRDSWFAGFSGDYLGVVWLGRDDNRSSHLSGAQGALQLWARTMKSISVEPVELIPPDNIELVWIDSATGLRGNNLCSETAQYPFIAGSAPEGLASCADTPVNKVRSWLRRLF